MSICLDIDITVGSCREWQIVKKDAPWPSQSSSFQEERKNKSIQTIFLAATYATSLDSVACLLLYLDSIAFGTQQ